MDEAFNQYEVAIREAQQMANGAQAGNCPRQMGVCEMLKEQAEAAKQSLK